jgi:hypothetical protein
MSRFSGEGEMSIASTAPEQGSDVEEPTRTPPPELAEVQPGRPPWSAPRGRDLLAGVAVLFVLVAILVVFERDADPPSRSAQALARASVAATATAPVPDWTDVPLATSLDALGPSLSASVAGGLAEARARIARCVAVERRVRPSPAPDPAGGRGPAELVLRLSPRSGAVHVVGVELRSAGGSAVLADCARRHLDGDTFPAEEAVPGRRHRLLVALE